MKIGYKDFWIELNGNDIKDKLEEFTTKIFYEMDANRKRDFTVALIDDRYYKTGYIIDYGKLRCSKKDFKKFNFAGMINIFNYFATVTLDKLFIGENEKYLIESTGELNGYEQDTPELSEFDLKIEI